MARRTFVVYIFLIGIAYAEVLDIQGIDEQDPTEDGTWSYYVTPNPRAVKIMHSNMFSKLPSIESLTIGNPTIHILMEKAKKRSAKLEMRLLQWTDYVNDFIVAEKQLERYINNDRDLEPDALMNFAEWCVSHDSAAPQGLLQKIFNLVVPMFKNQDLFNLVYQIIKNHPSGIKKWYLREAIKQGIPQSPAHGCDDKHQLSMLFAFFSNVRR